MRTNVLTDSALNTFRNCPRKYKLRYVDCLRIPDQPDNLIFGGYSPCGPSCIATITF